MRRSLSILAAAVIGITGALAGIGPAQAGAIRAAPAVLDQSGPSAGIIQVHKRKRHHRHRRGRVVYVVPQYVPVYPVHRYRSHRYYGYGSPGISLNFSIGGGHRYHGRRHRHGGHRW